MGVAIGIDLGTDNTVVSYVDKRGRLVRFRYGEFRYDKIPSVIYFESRSEYFIGRQAQNLSMINPAAGVKNFKTHIGDPEKYSITPEEGEPFLLRSREITKLFLHKIVNSLSEELIKKFGAIDGTIGQTIITVPGNFSSTQKGETRRAARDAGLDIVKIAAEPTAALIAYSNDGVIEKNDAVILVCKIDVRSFDVSIIRRDGNMFEEIARGGDKRLGGNVFTDKLVEYILEQVNDEYDLSMPFDEDIFYVLLRSTAENTAENILCEFIDEDFVTEYVILNDGKLFEIEFARQELDELLIDPINKMTDIINQTLEQARDRGIKSVDKFVSVGESAFIPTIAEMLSRKLNRTLHYADDETYAVIFPRRRSLGL